MGDLVDIVNASINETNVLQLRSYFINILYNNIKILYSSIQYQVYLVDPRL